MIIYQVDYDNHPLYKHGKTGRKQSPVRLFTNISPKDIVLPKDEGYRYQQLGCDHVIRNNISVIKLVQYRNIECYYITSPQGDTDATRILTMSCPSCYII